MHTNGSYTDLDVENSLTCFDHQSLAQLQKDLSMKLQEESTKPSNIGSTVRRPLHVLIKVTNFCPLDRYKLYTASIASRAWRYEESVL